MDTKKLRQKILDLAIRGKLVPQDPNDEPASVLLERIRAEKERLIAEGKIKRPKKSKASSAPSHYQQFEIPDSWEWATLGEVFSMQAGKSVLATELKEYNSQNPYPCFGGNGVRGYLSRYNHEGTHPIIGRQGALCGNINIAKGKFYATEHAVVVNYFANTNVMLWVLFLENLNLNQYATATAQPGLSVAKIEEVPIPVPPIQEQMRIVEAVQNWMECVGKLSVSSTQLSDSIKLAKSKILELAMQGKLVPQDPIDEAASDMLLRINPKAKIITDNPHSWNIPNSWCWTRVKDVFNPMKKAVPSGREFLYIDIDSVDNRTNTVSPKQINTEYAPSRALRKTQRGDIVFSMVRPYLRNVAVVPFDGCIASTGFYVLSGSSAIYPPFAFRLALSDFLVSGLNSYMKGDNSPSINKSDMEEFIIPLPPFNEQKRIISKIDDMYSLVDSIKASL